MEKLITYSKFLDIKQRRINEQYFRCDDCNYDSDDCPEDENWDDFLKRKNIIDYKCPKCGSQNTAID